MKKLGRGKFGGGVENRKKIVGLKD